MEDLDADEIAAVLMRGESRTVAQGATLFYKNTEADGLWMIEEGVVSILSGDDHDSSARLATLGPGQFVGEMGLIDGKTRSATAQADSPVRALLLDKQAIVALIKCEPATALKITRNIARELSHRVRHSSALLSEATSDTSATWANSSLVLSQRP
jgi:CRP-like cAMP-binding protein